MALVVHRKSIRFSVLGMLALLVCSCVGGGSYSPGPHYKIGSPYKIDGRWYHPKADPHYNKRGVASWYGAKFHGKKTANGEIFDKSRLTAAHKTLPLPSLVEVENLRNGRKVLVRVNDRGPFVDDRIIDLSEAAAKKLDFKGNGLAKVRVRFVAPAPLHATAPRSGNGYSQLGRRGGRALASASERSDDQQVALQSSPRERHADDLLVKANFDDTSSNLSNAASEEDLAVPAQTDSAHLTHFMVSALASQGAQITEHAPQPSADTALGERKSHWVTVAEFSSLEDVTAARLRLDDLGPSQVESRAGDYGMRHALLYGPYRDPMEARAWLEAALDAGFPAARLVTRVE